jgi:hypothetical protein
MTGERREENEEGRRSERERGELVGEEVAGKIRCEEEERII